jgi:hypothetical protein
MPGGYYVVIMDEYGNTTDGRIVRWTRDHGSDPTPWDSIMAVDFNVGGWVRFSRALRPGHSEAEAKNFVYLHWDPPGELDIVPGPSQFTYFDDQPLSSRDEGYQATAVNWFAEFVLSPYLTTRHYVVDPTDDVLAALDGNLPRDMSDVSRLAATNPELLRHVSCQEQAFLPSQLSQGAREVIARLLEDESSLQEYLEAPESFIGYASDQQPLPDEAEALSRAAREKQELIRRAFDSVELGRARGDGNTYILLGVDWEMNLPNQEALDWVLSELPAFVEENGYLPAFGPFVTEARMRYTVVLGPGVTEREEAFLRLFGHHIIDRRDGSSIGQARLDTLD